MKHWLSILTSVAWALMVIMLFVALCSCASMDADEIDYRHTVDRANWQNCENAYRREKEPTYHRHLHKGKMRVAEIRDDIFINGCRMALGDEWIDY